MMAFYYKKQEEAKKLEAESEDAYLNSAWANPKVSTRRKQQSRRHCQCVTLRRRLKRRSLARARSTGGRISLK
jgi:hypothetical protein